MLTAIAIVLGVAMIRGAYVLTDSIDQAFDKIFTESARARTTHIGHTLGSLEVHVPRVQWGVA